MTDELELRMLRGRRDDDLLDALYRELFLPNFPDPAEQEEPSDWAPRLWGRPTPPTPEQHGVVAGVALDDPPRRSLAGFAFVERYRQSRCALVSYIAVSSGWRGHGLSRRLLFAALEGSAKAAVAAGEPIRAVVGEIHDPRLVPPENDVIDPAERVRVMDRLGARLVPIDYVQPALGEDAERSHRLLLIAFPQNGEATIATDVVADFLVEYYRACDVREPRGDPDVSRMIAELGTQPVPLEPLDRLAEPG
jgi:GNAT superfamily N-acetyltransferase